MNRLFVDCFSGVSGDMLLAALLDLGWPVHELESLPYKLGLDGVKVEVFRVDRHGIAASQVQVKSLAHQHARSIRDIQALLEKAELKSIVRKRALEIFHLLADAEARVHGVSAEDIHFHEIGAYDTMIDVVGTLIAMDFLDIGQVNSAPLPLSRGFVRCSHGIVPLPAPAVLELLKDVPTYFVEEEFELVTPTGAVILRYIVDEWALPGQLTVSKVGYGAGTTDSHSRPNLLRLIMYLAVDAEEDEVIEMRTVIDDMTPEQLGALYELFLKNGALDFWITPVFMKKNRPAHELVLLCHKKRASVLERLVLLHTSSIGLRCFDVDRRVLKRRLVHVDTKWGRLKAKEVVRPDGTIEIVPEFDECMRVAREQKVPIRHVYDYIRIAACKND